MKNWIYIALVALFAGGTVACSEDDVTADPELSALPYELPRGEEGSLEEAIYKFHERYETYVLCDFSQDDLNNTWEDMMDYEIVPVKEEYRDCARELLDFMMDDVFSTYPDEFIAQLLPRRIFLVDTIISVDGEMTNVENISSNHSMVISRVGKEMAEFTPSDWDALNVELTGLVLGNLTVPQEFYDLINYEYLTAMFGLVWGEYVEDPTGEYDDYHYTIYYSGYLDSDSHYDDMGMFYAPAEMDDLADYLVYFMSTPATEIEHLCGRFEVIKNRARVVVQSLLEEQDLDLIAIQNSNCPTDPLAADFFDE